MSEIDDLVKRLRRLDYKTDLDEDAANALEMQAKWLEGFVKHSDEMAIALSSKATQADHLFVENDKLRARIAELERREKHLEEMFHGWRDEAQKGCARIAELEAREADALQAATILAVSLAEKHWPENMSWCPLDETAGVITQINNMCAGLDARIAELEAENKTLREALKPISQWSFEAQDGSPAIKELHDDILRVRAALSGERSDD